jgi:predicted anti-sigma-YlaC factor YlaD
VFVNCATARRLLSRAGSASPEQEVRDHLEGCESCRRFADGWATVAGELGNPLCEVQPDAAFAAKVVARLPAQAEPLAWAALRLFPAAAALALVLLGWCFAATPGPTELTASSSSSDPLVWVVGSQEDDG